MGSLELMAKLRSDLGLVPTDLLDEVPLSDSVFWEFLSMELERSGDDTLLIDFVSRNPQLTKALAIVSREHGCALPEEWYKLRRRRIVELIGAKNANATVSLFDKTDPAQIDGETLHLIINLSYDDDGMRYIRHCRRVNRSVLFLVADITLRQFLTHRFISEIGCNQDYGYFYSVASFVIGNWGGRDRRRIRSIHQLGKIRESIISSKLMPEVEGMRLYYPFPRYEKNGFSAAPITQAMDLYALGKRLNNCLGRLRFFQYILETQCYNLSWYFVAREQLLNTKLGLASLAFDQKESRWKVIELRGPRNQHVDKGLKSAVLEWLIAVQEPRRRNTL